MVHLHIQLWEPEILLPLKFACHCDRHHPAAPLRMIGAALKLGGHRLRRVVGLAQAGIHACSELSFRQNAKSASAHTPDDHGVGTVTSAAVGPGAPGLGTKAELLGVIDQEHNRLADHAGATRRNRLGYPITRRTSFWPTT